MTISEEHQRAYMDAKRLLFSKSGVELMTELDRALIRHGASYLEVKEMVLSGKANELPERLEGNKLTAHYIQQVVEADLIAEKIYNSLRGIREIRAGTHGIVAALVTDRKIKQEEDGVGRMAAVLTGKIAALNGSGNGEATLHVQAFTDNIRAYLGLQWGRDR